jgi:hypothetical protein
MASKRKVVPVKKASVRRAPAKKQSSRRAPTKKSSDIKDILDWIEKKTNPVPKKGATAATSAISSTVKSASGKTIRGAVRTGKGFKKGTEEVGKFFVGDPSKGWQDVALTSGSWFIPYEKGAKGINAVIKGTSKGKKVLRGAAKTVGFLGAQSAYEKGIKSIGGKKKTTGGKKIRTRKK